MRMSDSITELAKALVGAQSELDNPPMTGVNPHFKSKYATLIDIIKTTKPILCKYGLAVIQGAEAGGVVITILVHESGQWVEFTTPIKPVQDTPQAIGSALTYGRRYGRQSILDLAGDEDDDGNAATATSTTEKAKVVSPEGASRVANLLTAIEEHEPGFPKKYLGLLNVSDPTELRTDQLPGVVTQLEKRLKQNEAKAKGVQ